MPPNPNSENKKQKNTTRGTAIGEPMIGGRNEKTDLYASKDGSQLANDGSQQVGDRSLE